MPVSFRGPETSDFASSIVTGASGFVGSALVPMLDRPVALSLGSPDWRARMAATDFAGAVVYHLAARVHDAGSGGEAAYMEDNHDKTLELARSAAAAGARGFVFLSTAKVNGEETREAGFTAHDAPRPEDAYARSKWAAERSLAALASRSGLPVAIVRPPLVFGPGAKANLHALLRICDSALPLPFASIRNRRSFIDASDLARLLRAAVHREPGVTRTYMAAHPQPFSTPELARGIRAALGRPARLIPFPPAALEALAALAGRRSAASRLTRSLEVDARETEAALGWAAGTSLERSIATMVAAYRGVGPA